MNTNEELLIRYAENRINLRATQEKISSFGFCKETQTFDDAAREALEASRKEYFSEPYEDNYGWPGWVRLLNDTISYQDVPHPDTYKLAVLLDRRREINREAGNIKRAIAARGRALLRKAA